LPLQFRIQRHKGLNMFWGKKKSDLKELTKDTLKSRAGQFVINRSILDEEPGIAMKIMSACIITRAEYILSADRVEYMANSLLFDSLEPGECVPWYTITVISEQGEETFRFNRSDKISDGNPWRFINKNYIDKVNK
jgi:hypothetical protein